MISMIIIWYHGGYDIYNIINDIEYDMDYDIIVQIRDIIVHNLPMNLAMIS